MITASYHPTEIKVSVCMITYNHEAYIAQAIESVLMQQTDFLVELVIGEDFSTDGTRDIVRKYEKLNPGRIRSLLPEHNLGMHANAVATLQACGGKYIALCEGDDYWISDSKLQTQVNFLDQHPEYSLCFHDVLTVDENGILIQTDIIRTAEKEDYCLHDILKSNYFQSCSVLFRHQFLPIYPEWIYEAPMGDWPLFTILAQRGRIRRIIGQMAAYRVHPDGYWSKQSLSTRLRKTIQTAKIMKKNLGKDVERELNHTILIFQLRWLKSVIRSIL